MRAVVVQQWIVWASQGATDGWREDRHPADPAIGQRPLTITHDQIDEMMVLIGRCLDLTLHDATCNGWLN